MKVNYGFYKLQFLLLALASTFFACEDEKDDNGSTTTELKVVTVADLPADPGKTGIPTYYSLSDSSIIAAADSATTKWDFAVSSTSILLNDGVSAAVTDGILEKLAEAPAEGYESSAAPKTWYSYSSETHIVTPVAGKILVFQLADGTYAKLEVISYYKGNPDLTGKVYTELESRYYTFRYVYQPDGSTSFK